MADVVITATITSKTANRFEIRVESVTGGPHGVKGEDVRIGDATTIDEAQVVCHRLIALLVTLADRRGDVVQRIDFDPQPK
jgi:hypothetical protein